MSVNEKMTAIADAIRAKAGGTDTLTLDGMAAAIPEVYTAGEKSAYDAFWDEYQIGGNRTQYENAFAGQGWDDNTFNPKYAIRPTSAYMMFRGSKITDLQAIMERIGIELDFSKCTSFLYVTSSSSITHLGTVSTLGASAIQSLLASSNVETVDKLILKTNGTQTFESTFNNCSTLKNITIEGVIGKAIDLHWSTALTKDSITSIVNALSDTTSGIAVTISKTASDSAFTDDEWAALIATKPNWTFTLA